MQRDCSLLGDEELLASFENCALAIESFHHADHVRVAFLYLRHYPPLEALQRLSTSLTRFATAYGKPRLYHETITWALAFLIRERMASTTLEQTWIEFAAHNADLLDWKENVLKQYYRPETLSSELAKRVFLLPDYGPNSKSL
jgi:hypothetical protein